MGVLFENLTLIGLGHEGSSIAWAAKRSGLVGRITGYARTRATRDRALELGFADRVTETAAKAAEGADLVILCIPVGICGAVTAEIASALKPGAILSDVGSVKAGLIADVAPHVPEGIHFVPAHPLAGTEHSGPDSGFAELFDNRWCILTPLKGCDPAATDRMQVFWEGLGANVDRMDPQHHDLVLAVTSHVPHAIAYTMVGVADHLRRVTDSEVINFSAAGFRDFTRIAASDPTMWRDVFLNNRDATLDILGRFSEELALLQRAIRMGDGEYLHDYFTRTRAIRRGIIDAGQDTPAANFGRGSRGSDAGGDDPKEDGSKEDGPKEDGPEA